MPTCPLVPPSPMPPRRVQVSRHHQFGSLGALLERFDDPLYCRGVVGGEVTFHDVPTPHPRYQLEADDVGSKLWDGLHRKTRRRPVEDCHSATVSARRVCRDDAIPSRPAGVYTVCHFCFIERCPGPCWPGTPPLTPIPVPRYDHYECYRCQT